MRKYDKQPGESNRDYCNRIASYIDPKLVLAEIFDLYDEAYDHGEGERAVSLLMSLRNCPHGNGVRTAFRNQIADYADRYKEGLPGE